MAYEFSPADVRFLTSDDGADALATAAGMTLTGRSQIADLTRLRRQCGDHAPAVAETVRLRRLAASRWRVGVGNWLLTDTALQQASPPAVAAHRAARIGVILNRETTRYDAVHDVTCSIGSDLAALGAAGVAAVGSDLDPVRLAMARHNLRAIGLPTRLLRADARTATTRHTVRYADPARRDAAGRRISSADTIPTVAELDAADPARPPILRLPPGIDYERLGRPGEIELVSWRGAVREAISWPAGFATAGRRATVLVDGEATGDRAGTAVEQLTDADPSENGVIPAARFLVEPDPAVIRAHLVTQYAARHGLALIDPHLAYLTGDTVPAGVRGFEIIDAAPMNEKTVKSWVRRDAAGTLEIKQRGTPVVPDELRRRVKPRGDRRIARTLMVARIGRDVRAFWCRAVVGEPRAHGGDTPDGGAQ